MHNTRQLLNDERIELIKAILEAHSFEEQTPLVLAVCELLMGERRESIFSEQLPQINRLMDTFNRNQIENSDTLSGKLDILTAAVLELSERVDELENKLTDS